MDTGTTKRSFPKVSMGTFAFLKCFRVVEKSGLHKFFLNYVVCLFCILRQNEKMGDGFLLVRSER